MKRGNTFAEVAIKRKKEAEKKMVASNCWQKTTAARQNTFDYFCTK